MLGKNAYLIMAVILGVIILISISFISGYQYSNSSCLDDIANRNATIAEKVDAAKVRQAKIAELENVASVVVASKQQAEKERIKAIGAIDERSAEVIRYQAAIKQCLQQQSKAHNTAGTDKTGDISDIVVISAGTYIRVLTEAMHSPALAKKSD